MNIYVRKDGSVLGPFTRADVESHMQRGTFAPADPARLEGSMDWRTLSAVRAGDAEIPPHLHSGLVFALTVMTLGIFGMLWTTVQLTWIKKLDNDLSALLLFVFSIVMQSLPPIASGVFGVEFPESTAIALFGLVILMVILQFYAIIRARNTMLTYFNETEPIGLKMDIGLTILLNTAYLQYHMNRIATWKKTGVLPD